jgi:hypothetical protein
MDVISAQEAQSRSEERLKHRLLSAENDLRKKIQVDIDREIYYGKTRAYVLLEHDTDSTLLTAFKESTIADDLRKSGYSVWLTYSDFGNYYSIGIDWTPKIKYENFKLFSWLSSLYKKICSRKS